MAAHGKTGAALKAYHDRRRRPREVEGMYVSDGATTKPTRLSKTAYMRKLRLRGASRVGKKKGEPSKASGGIVHWRPARCEGR